MVMPLLLSSMRMAHMKLLFVFGREQDKDLQEILFGQTMHLLQFAFLIANMFQEKMIPEQFKTQAQQQSLMFRMRVSLDKMRRSLLALVLTAQSQGCVLLILVLHINKGRSSLLKHLEETTEHLRKFE